MNGFGCVAVLRGVEQAISVLATVIVPLTKFISPETAKIVGLSIVVLNRIFKEASEATSKEVAKNVGKKAAKVAGKKVAKDFVKKAGEKAAQEVNEPNSLLFKAGSNRTTCWQTLCTLCLRHIC